MTESTVRVPKANGPIGASIENRDARTHVTGRTVYVDDVQFPNMAHLVIARSGASTVAELCGSPDGTIVPSQDQS